MRLFFSFLLVLVVSCASIKESINPYDCSALVEDFETSMKSQISSLKSMDEDIVAVIYKMSSARCFDSNQGDIRFEITITKNVVVEGEPRKATVTVSIEGYLFYDQNMKPMLTVRNQTQKKFEIVKKV
jgi:hypothetical protein